MIQTLFATYRDVGLANPASDLIIFPCPAGTILGFRIKLFSGNTVGDAVFNISINGVEQFTTQFTVPNGDDEKDVTGLSIVTTNDDRGGLNIDSPFPTTLPDPPFGLYITYDDGISVTSSGGGGGLAEDGPPGES